MIAARSVEGDRPWHDLRRQLAAARRYGRGCRARRRAARVERRGVGRAGAGERRGSGRRRLAPEQPDPARRRLLQARPGVAVGAVQQQPRPQLRLGIRLVLGQDARRQSSWRGSIARLLMRISWLATATNELDVADPVVLERRERVEVGLGEVAERDASARRAGGPR